MISAFFRLPSPESCAFVPGTRVLSSIQGAAYLRCVLGGCARNRHGLDDGGPGTFRARRCLPYSRDKRHLGICTIRKSMESLGENGLMTSCSDHELNESAMAQSLFCKGRIFCC